MANNSSTTSPTAPSPLAQRIADAFKLVPQPVVRTPQRNAEFPKPSLKKPSFLDRLDAWFWRQEQKDVEAWLAQSGNVFELERRIRDVGHGAGMRYW